MNKKTHKESKIKEGIGYIISAILNLPEFIHTNFSTRTITLAIIISYFGIMFLWITVTVYAINDSELEASKAVPVETSLVATTPVAETERTSVTAEPTMTSQPTNTAKETKQVAAKKVVKEKKKSTKEQILEKISETELYYLAKCVEIEAEAEGVRGKIAVTNVIMNRVNSKKFPNTFKGVITQKSKGIYQFSSYETKRWATKKPTEETYKAILKALNGTNLIGKATYFCNMNIVKGGWFYTAPKKGQLKKVDTIGCHTFFVEP